MGEDLAAIAADLMEAYGDTTRVGEQAFPTFWDEAQPGRAQQYLKEEEWGLAAYEVQFPAKARAVLKAGIEIVRSEYGMKAVVRHPDLPGMQDTPLLVYALVVVLPRQ